MVAMTSLKKAKGGDWFSRKAIPEDVREAYLKAYGLRREERFRLPASTPSAKAMAEFRDWDATISSRIDQLRAARTGNGIALTQRQISTLSGDWYRWFVAQHEEEPGTPEAWDIQYERLLSAQEKFATDDNNDEEEDNFSPVVRRHVEAQVIELGRIATFLAEKGMRLDEETTTAFLGAVREELVAAFALLRRRADGDFSPDQRLARFASGTEPAAAKGVKLAGLDCWQAFDAWVRERQPAVATVGRWRSVFLNANEHFEGRDVATITPDEAVAWKDSLLNGRSAQVVNGVWLRAVVTVFNWLKANKKVTENVFAGVKVAAGKKRKTREREFIPDEWKAILKASLAPPPPRLKRQKAAARRWVPWLCAYTGARGGEMTQLHGSSVYEEDGVWLIEISPEDGTVKGASFRKVPIHEHLIEQGFLEFVKQIGKGPLFYDPDEKKAASPDPTKPVRPPYVIALNKLAEWVRQDVGVTDPDISPNHAWRHTFKRIAARAGMERRFRFAFCGHEDGDVGDQYETPTLRDMAEELKKFPRYKL